MATEDVGIRLTLQGRREVAAGLSGTSDDLKKVGDEGEKAGKRASSGFAKLGSKVLGVAKIVGKTAIAGGIALIGTALYKGFQRLNAIDQATAKLKGLGHSAKSVDKIMGSALKSVKGTAFGLDEAATVAAGTVAAGIKPGQQLTKTLKLVADAATIGGISMGDMGAIFNKVATSNKVQGDVINQLNDKGIPIVQLLGKSMHKTSDEVMKMSKKGQIGFAQFSKAMQQGVGGAALKSGNTFSGSYKNLMASVGRIGAGLMGGLFPHLAPGIQGITNALGPLEKRASAAGDKIGKVLGPAFEKIGPWITSLGPKLSSLGPKFNQFKGWVSGIDFSKLTGGSSQVGKAFSDIGASLKGVDFSQLSKSFGQGAADSISVFAVVIGFLAKHLNTLAKYMPVIIAAYAAFKVAQAAQNILGIASIPIRVANTAALFASAAANRSLAAAMGTSNAAERVGMLTRARGVAVTIATTAAGLAASAATKVWAAGQWLLNAALTANPIGLVVVAIAALVGGFILAYKHSETFRNIVNGALRAVGQAGIWLWNNALQPAFHAIVGGIATMIGFFAKLVSAGASLPGVLGAPFRAAKPAVDRLAAGMANLTDKIRKIPRDVPVKVTANTGAASAALAGVSNQMHKMPRNAPVTVTANTGAASAAIGGIGNQINNLPHNPVIRVAIMASVSASVGAAAGISKHASGTNFAPGGIALVGERGPELVNLPRGSQVKTATQTRQMMATSLPAVHPIATDSTDERSSGGGRPLVIQNQIDGKTVSEVVVGHLQGRLARA